MAGTPPPFAPYEWLIAWRYLRARKADGGVSTMTWISLIGVTLAVFALVATLAIRAGLRADFVETILGANAHVTVYNTGKVNPDTGAVDRSISDYAEVSQRVLAVPGVTRAAPLIKGQVMANMKDRNAGVQVFGISADDLKSLPAIVNPDTGLGDIERFSEGAAIGSGVARELNVGLGDKIRLINPSGNITPLGVTPRINAYEVVYIFNAGRLDIDKVRVYLPFEEAQSFLNRDGAADEIEVMVSSPEAVDDMALDLMRAAGERGLLWTWKDSTSGILRALQLQDNALFILLSILVLIASMNIISGLIMLVKNKGRDIGILRTMGLNEGAILRIFFICGASVGTVGTIFGVILGVIFSLNIESIYALLNSFTGNSVRELEIQGFIFPPAVLRFGDIALAVAVSLGLSWIITIFPARRAARMNPVEALRYE